MLFLRLDQAKEFLAAAKTLREKLVSRYFLLNGLAPMELSKCRIEYLDPIECTLFLPKRHWKRNCIADIDAETVKMQIMYSGDRTEGPLIRVRGDKQPHRATFNLIIKRIADRTTIPRKEKICPLVLKRTFARLWIKTTHNICTLQKQFSHKHIWSTGHYLRFVMEDVTPDHRRMMDQVDPLRLKKNA